MSLRMRSVECHLSNNSQVAASTALNQTALHVKQTSPTRRNCCAFVLRVALLTALLIGAFSGCDELFPSPNGAGGSREPVLPGRSSVDRIVNALPSCIESENPTPHMQVDNHTDRVLLLLVAGDVKARIPASDPDQIQNESSSCKLRIEGLPDTPTRLSTQFYEYTETNFEVVNEGGNNVVKPKDGINVYVGRPGVVLASTVQQPYSIRVDPNSGGDALGIITFKYACSGNTSVDIYDVSLRWSCPSDLSNTPQVGKVLTIANTITQFDISRPLENHQFAYFYIGEHDSRAVSCGLSSPVSLSSSYTHDEVDITCAPTTPTLTVQNNHTDPVVIFANNHRLEGALSFFKNAPNARRNVATIREGTRQLYRLQSGDYTIKAFLVTDIFNATRVSGETPFAQSRYESGSSIDLAVDVMCTITGRGLMQCVQSLPDLVVLNESVEVDRSSVNIGGEIVVSLKVHNNGDGGAAAATLRYYRSVDATIDSTDTSVGTGTIGVLSAGTTTPRLPHRISIADALTPGVYYYGACVERVEHETNTNNNCSNGVRVRVTEPLAAPDLTVRGGNRQVSLSWGSVSNASSYRIYWGTSSGSLTRLSANPTGTSYTHTGLADGTTYYYQISAYSNISGEGARSSLRSATTTTPLPGQPSLTARGGNRQVSLSWGNVSGAHSYRIYWGTSSGSLTRLSANPTGTSYTHTGLADGTTYYYQVSAYNNISGEGARSSLRSATTITSPLDSRDGSKDFNTLIAAGNKHPHVIWSDGTILWVTDPEDNKIYAYNMASKARESSNDFNTLSAAGNTNPSGIWSNGTTLWVADWDDDKIYAYNLVSKARENSKDFNTLIAAGNNGPRGLWSNGITMWVADDLDDKIYAYNLASKARDSSKDINTLSAAGNNGPRGTWSNGTTLWVADLVNAKIYAYNLASKEGDSSKDINILSAAGNNHPHGIWSNGPTLWVIDQVDDKIYAYHMGLPTPPPPSPTPTFRDSSKDLNTLIAAGNTVPQSIWSDRTTLWVTDAADDKIYAYNIMSQSRDSSKDFNTLSAAGNGYPNGIWSDGTTLWSSDWHDDKIYAYNLASKARDSSKEFNTLRAAGNTDAAGLWVERHYSMGNRSC